MNDRNLDDLRIPSAERLAVNACAEVEATRILCKTVGRGQCAAALAERLPSAEITCHFLDVYPAEDAVELTADRPNIRIECSPDLPDNEIDLFVLPISRSGEAELNRDWLQQGYEHLAIGGLLIATVDNPKDVWLHHEIEKLGKNVSRTPKRHGVTYRIRKQKPARRIRNFTSEFAFRDGERLIQVVSRPGVFSHRRIDAGARALIETMNVQPGQWVLDIGCGSGVVGLAAAGRAEGVRVHCVDSNARAIQCTRIGAECNDIHSLTTTLTAEGELLWEDEDLSGQFDLALGNPPYFSRYQIAELFLQTARRGLKPGGEVIFVTKQAEWLQARMEQLFLDLQIEDVRGYTVVRGRKPGEPNPPSVE